MTSESKPEIEYIVVSNLNSKVIFASYDYQKAKNQAHLVRQAGGQVTVFKSLKA